MSLGLSYISTILRNQGHEVLIYNADFKPLNDYLTQEQLISESKNFKKKVDDLNNPIYREIVATVKLIKPDIVGLSVLSSNYVISKNIGKLINGLNIRLWAGGPQIMLDPEMAKKDFEYISTGDYIKDYNIIPDRENYIHDEAYMDFGYIMTGTGCNNNCVFCASRRIRDKVIFRDTSIVMAEVREAKKYTDTLYFIDDTFTLNRRRAGEICRQLIYKNIKWKCDTRLDKLDKELLTLMKQSGCIRVKTGVESGSDRILKSINKHLTVGEIKKKVNEIKEVGIPLTVYLMIGFPEETNKDVQMTIDLAKWIEADYYSLSIVTPYPGTRLYDRWKSKDWQYLHHQNKKLVMNDKISDKMLDEFLDINKKYAKGNRI